MATTKWPNEYPQLCRGEWNRYIEDIDYSRMVPASSRPTIYRKWWFEDWHFVDGADDLDYNEWIIKNPWITDIPVDPYDLYCALRAEERHRKKRNDYLCQ